MLKFVFLAASTVAGAYILTAVYLLFSLDRLVYYPAADIEAEPADFDLPADEVTFTAEDGTGLHGWYFPRPGSRAVIVFLHGNAGNISHRLFIARQLLRAPANLFLFDYRGYGRSDGTPEAERPLLDVRAALGAARKHPGSAGKMIVLMGESLGGTMALMSAADVEVSGVITLAAFTSVRDVARDMPFYRLFAPLVPNRFDALRAVGDIRVPLLFVHGTGDEIIPFSHGEALYNAAKGDKGRLWVKGGRHNDLFEVAGIEIVDAVTRFIASLDDR